MKNKMVASIMGLMLCLTACFGGINENVIFASDATEDTSQDASQVLVDQDGILVEYRGIEEYSSESWIINLYVENNTENDFYLSLDNTLINGNLVPISNNGINIQAGSKYLSEPNFELVIDTDNLAEYGITEVSDISFDVDVRTDIFGDEILNIPAEIGNINKSVSEEPAELNAGKVILDQDGLHVEYLGISEYSDQSWIVSLYAENNSDDKVYLSLNDVLVNGYNVNLSNNGVNIPAHAKYLSSPNFDLIINTDDLESYGIEKIDTLTGTLNISTGFLGDTIVETSVDLSDEKQESEQQESESLESSSTETKGKIVLDQDDFHVEYLGISEYSDESWIINLYAENNSDDEVYLSLNDVLVNGYNINLSNNGASIPAHSKYLAEPNFDLIINTEVLEAYDIDKIDTLTGTLNISTGLFGDTIVETQVDLSNSEQDAEQSESTEEEAKGTEAETEVSSESMTETETVTEDTSDAVGTMDESDENTLTDFETVTKGDSGEIVTEIQKILIDAGYLDGEADGKFGDMTEQAVLAFQNENGLNATGEVDTDTYSLLLKKKTEMATANMPEGLSLDEKEWDSWESNGGCTLFPFMKACDKAGFTFSLPSGQEETHKEGYFDFKDGDTTTTLDQVVFYYGVENQHMLYTGLYTDNPDTFNSDDFREACIRLMLGYNIHYDQASDDAVLNLTRERAEEIVNYCFDNDVKHCVVDDMRIRILRNDANDNYYSFHMEY